MFNILHSIYITNYVDIIYKYLIYIYIYIYNIYIHIYIQLKYAESFWVILGLILAVLLRVVKPLLIKGFKDVFCVTPMLTALKTASQIKKVYARCCPLLGAI